MTTKNKNKTFMDAIKGGLWKVDIAMRDAHRWAALLDWGAQHYPYDHIEYHYVLKAIHGYKHTPSLGNKDVDRLRSKMSAMKKVLMSQYGRTTDNIPGVGIRATVDGMDKKRALKSAAKRLISSATGYDVIRDSIDVTLLPKTVEGRAFKEFLENDANKVMSAVTKPGYLERLLPPKTDDEKDK